jgi:hypothetical protein
MAIGATDADSTAAAAKTDLVLNGLKLDVTSSRIS